MIPTIYSATRINNKINLTNLYKPCYLRHKPILDHHTLIITKLNDYIIYLLEFEQVNLIPKLIKYTL